MAVHNASELVQLMEKLATEALEKVVEDVLEIFKRDYIMGMAYIKNPKEYTRTFEFSEAWDFTPIKSSLLSLVTELWYDPSKMRTFDPDRFIHGSKYSSPPDVRDNLPAILEGKRSSLWISVDREKQFWQEFMVEMFSNGKLDSIISKRFREKGFEKI
jgi:hypothetical protein